MLKLATEEDRYFVKRMAYRFFENSPYSHLQIDDGKVDTLVTTLLRDSNDKSIVLLYIDPHGGMPIGILAASVTEVIFSSDKVAAELIWWVEPEYRGKAGLKLLEAFEFWATKIGCKHIQMVSLDFNVGRIYEKRGYQLKELAYLKDI